ncbi:hypothetical protein VDG1235_3542 [Verrucomicrobiia bacterium DG1235]|nr:hypothetical protein VDG1235_3542 [Verrucomicrobiae bacterium DG1235]
MARITALIDWSVYWNKRFAGLTPFERDGRAKKRGRLCLGEFCSVRSY